MTTKIDIYAHIIPEAFLKAMQERAYQAAAYYTSLASRVPSIIDLQVRFQIMDQFGEDYRQVLNTAGFAQDLPTARLVNDTMAELVDRYPDRFVAFGATLPMADVEGALLELDRAIGELGARGIQLFANINGIPLDDPRFFPIFERMAKHDLPIWLHPMRSSSLPDFATEDRSRYLIWRVFGWPYETTAALVRLVFAGYFKRFPNLKIIAHHAGGLLPHFAERVQDHYKEYILWQDEELQPGINELDGHPLDYLRLIYGDTALSGSQGALNCALAFLGSDRLLFGSDFPFDIEKGARLVAAAVRGVEGLPVSPAEREAIFAGNAIRLLKLPS